MNIKIVCQANSWTGVATNRFSRNELLLANTDLKHQHVNGGHAEHLAQSTAVLPFSLIQQLFSLLYCKLKYKYSRVLKYLDCDHFL